MHELIETTKMSTRGQVIIPKDVREYIHAGEDTIFTVMPLDKETILMKKIDKKKLIDEFIKIRNNTKKLSLEEVRNEIRAHREI